MEITVNVNINAPGLEEAIRSVAMILSATPLQPVVAFQGEQEQSKSEFSFKLPSQEASKADQATTTAEENVKPEQPTEDPKPETPTYTLEEVRAKLAALSQAGKQAEVKKIITDAGAKKLTDIPVEKYAEVMKAAEGL